MDEQALQGFLAALWGLARLICAAGTLIAGLVFLFRALFPPPKPAYGSRLAPPAGALDATDGADAGAAGPRGSPRPAAARGPALPRRPGLREFGAVCAGAVTRGYYRSLVAERLRALGRDALALGEELSEEEAYRRLRTGRGFLSEDASDLLLSDHFAARPGREGPGGSRLPPAFLRRLRRFPRLWKPAPGRGPDTSFATPFLTRVDAYLNDLNDYMQGPGGNDGQHKD